MTDQPSSADRVQPVAQPETSRVRIDSCSDGGEEYALAEDTLDGLTRPLKELAPKHLYDARGAQLFDRICALPEYYPARTERAILERFAGEIAATTKAMDVVELGSGTAVKSRLLLHALYQAGVLGRYVAIDVTEGLLRKSAVELAVEYPGLEVHGIIGDFEHHLRAIPPPRGRRVIVFFGGTIGNFLPGSRRRFLRKVAGLLAPGDYLLMGTDLVKDPGMLEDAYDDAAGVTAEFNRNALYVLNRRLAADFVPQRFAHVAYFDRQREWIEMRLRATIAHTATVRDLGLTVRFEAGEEIRTEISAKFTKERLAGDLAAAGMQITSWMTDPAGLFALTLSRPN